MVIAPYQQIQEHLSLHIPSELIKDLPRKWEKIGKILVIKLPSSLNPYKDIIGEIYAKVLTCESVLVDTGGISGQYREPVITQIYGEKNTETVHFENGIEYTLDPQFIMFSSGNMDERIRMGTISNQSETIVDLFSGIGYFTIPMAVYSRPKRIIACEINPAAFRFLQMNIKRNKVENIVEPHLGDSRILAPNQSADRVIMGYFHKTRSFLPTALESLKNHCGIIHYHDIFPDSKIPKTPLNIVQLYCSRYDRIADLTYYHQVKSYAPGISHYVFDFKILEDYR